MAEYIEKYKFNPIITKWKQAIESEDEKMSFTMFQNTILGLQKVYDHCLSENKRAFNDSVCFDVVGSVIDIVVKKVSNNDDACENELRSCLWIEIGKYQTTVFRNAQKPQIKQTLGDPFHSLEAMLPDLNIEKKYNEEEEDDEELEQTKDLDNKEIDNTDEEEEDEGDEGDISMINDENEEEDNKDTKNNHDEDDDDMAGNLY